MLGRALTGLVSIFEGRSRGTTRASRSGFAKGTAVSVAGSVAVAREMNIECIVGHIEEDGSLLRLRVESECEPGAEATPGWMTGRVGATVFGRARKGSTYMIVLSRRNAVVGRRFVVALRVARVPTRFFGGRVAGLTGVSSRRAPGRSVSVGVW